MLAAHFAQLLPLVRNVALRRCSSRSMGAVLLAVLSGLGLPQALQLRVIPRTQHALHTPLRCLQ